MKFILYSILVVFVGVFTKIEAQEYTFSDYLKSSVPSADSRFLDYKFSSPLINEISVRTRTDNFKPAKQRVSLKFGFSSLKARKNETQYIQWQEKNFQQNAKNFTKENLYQTTRQWSNLYFTETNVVLMGDLANLYKEKESFLTKIVAIDPGEIKKINEIQLKTLNIEVKKETGSYNVEIQKRELNKKLSVSQGVNFRSIENYVSISAMEENIQQIASDSTISEDILKIESRLNANQYEYTIEKANNSRLLDYLELGRNDFESNNNFRETYTVGVGFLLPASRKKNMKLAELEIEKNYLTHILPIEKQKLSNEIKNLTFELQSQIRMFKLYKDYLLKLEPKLKLKKVNAQMANDLLEILLDNKILYAEKKIELNELHQKMVENYIKLLQLTLQDSLVKL